MTTTQEALRLAEEALNITLNVETAVVYLEAIIKALQEQPAEQEPDDCYPCKIVTADFSENTVTVEMLVDGYIVSAGKKYLCDAAPPKAEQEPVGEVKLWTADNGFQNSDINFNKRLRDGTHKLYTAPPQREWVSLTDYELAKALGWKFGEPMYEWVMALARTAILADREKNGCQ